jgi:hypothetical protein
MDKAVFHENRRPPALTTINENNETLRPTVNPPAREDHKPLQFRQQMTNKSAYGIDPGSMVMPIGQECSKARRTIEV